MIWPRQMSVGLLIPAILLSGMLSAWAQDFRTGTRSNKVGNADHFGYVRIVKDLGRLPVGGSGLDLKMVFSSDPEIEPGAFGPGWHIPLFASTVYPSRQGVFVWEAPDEYRRFFVYDSKAKVRSGEKAYKHQGDEWRALANERRGTILIEETKDPEAFFRYKDGRLESFRLDAGSKEVTVEYTSRGEPRTLRVSGVSEPLFEVDYLSSTPERIKIGDREIEIELGKGDWTAPDGKSDYQDYRVRYLTALKYSDDRTEHFAYTKDAEKNRSSRIVDPRDAEKFIQRRLDVPVNRLTITDANGSKSWVSFEAQSGFVVADSGGQYNIKNDAYDPHIAGSDKKGAVSPRAVSIEREPVDGGSKQSWSRDWPKGVEIISQSDGSLIRNTWIIAEGPAYGKLRRVESFEKDNWKLTKVVSYDSMGNIARSSNYESNIKRHYRNQELVFESHAGNVVYQKFLSTSSNEMDGILFTVNSVLGNGQPVQFLLRETSNGRALTHEGKTISLVNKNKLSIKYNQKSHGIYK